MKKIIFLIMGFAIIGIGLIQTSQSVCNSAYSNGNLTIPADSSCTFITWNNYVIKDLIVQGNLSTAGYLMMHKQMAGSTPSFVYVYNTGFLNITSGGSLSGGTPSINNDCLTMGTNTQVGCELEACMDCICNNYPDPYCCGQHSAGALVGWDSFCTGEVEEALCYSVCHY